MFRKKIESEPGKPSLADARKALVTKITSEAQQLKPGESLIYKLPEFFWTGAGAFFIAELNPEYPKKGKKYLVKSDKIKDGKPAGVKGSPMQFNNPEDVAKWISNCYGQWGSPERFDGTGPSEASK